MKLKTLLILLFLSLSSSFAFAANKTTTLVTYYPAPSGEYDDLTVSGTLTAANLNMTGNLGIGTTVPAAALDVNGGIKIGNTDTCSSALAGLMRYNGSGIQFCDSDGNWQGAGGVRAYQAVGVQQNPQVVGGAGWIPLPDMSITLTPASSNNPILIMFSGSFQGDTGLGGRTSWVQIWVDGVPIDASPRSGHPDSSKHATVATQAIVSLSAGQAHTIKIYFATSEGTMTAMSIYRTLSVIEYGAAGSVAALPPAGGGGSGTYDNVTTSTLTFQPVVSCQNPSNPTPGMMYFNPCTDNGHASHPTEPMRGDLMIYDNYGWRSMDIVR